MTETATPSATPGPVPAPTGPLDIAALEAVYDTLAQAIDQAGEGRSELFLVKLALLQANALGDAGAFAAQVAEALRDL